MASKSKWANADDDEETAAALTQRKQEKEEKRRLKEEKAQKAAAAAQNVHPSASTVVENGSNSSNTGERPAKRQRTDADQGNDAPTTSPAPQSAPAEEGAHLLQFASRGFGPCSHVDDFELLNNIEEGSYGVVSRARRKASGELVALKKLKMDHNNSGPGDGFPVMGLREIQTLMASRQHANVVTLQEVVVGESLKDVYLVMEFVPHDLKTLLEDMAEPFLPSEIKTLMLQLVAGVQYLHDNWILHRDLKTSNLLLNNRGELKLADFGMARYTSSPPPRLTQLVVTLWYRAPELLLGAEEYGFEIDMWSIGCIFAELLTREPLLQGKTEVDQLAKILVLAGGTPSNDTWPGFRSLPNAKALHSVLVSHQTSSKPSSTASSSTTTANTTTATTTASGVSQITASNFPYLSASGLRLLSALLALNPASRPSASEVLRSTYFKEDPRPKAKEIFPTFPSKANQERRRRRETPQAPVRGANAPRFDEGEFEGVFGRAMEEREDEEEQHGAGFALRLG